MVVTHKKKAKRFYCIDKSCILPRHPYFWRGLITVTKSVKQRLEDGHKDLLLAMLKFEIGENYTTISTLVSTSVYVVVTVKPSSGFPINLQFLKLM